MSLPFNLSYIILTPRHVALPGQKVAPGAGASPRKKRSTVSPGRWLGRLVMKTRSFRYRKYKYSTNPVTKPLLEPHAHDADVVDDFLMGGCNETPIRDVHDLDKTDDSGDPNATVGTAVQVGS
ncbi:hypothetical protein E1B28_007241 [Marasmius oreades]|uniref:Uncharacterized protein n=1 Tax=Marasmius oreades TaxID=181124 RepID=A0A9P7UUQ4_9AGAR|nr:uncharacterized protein E1B28_007241 [Marasmius oreades]KAG7093571.1 hypothetical protein E1B28_007241 [Marasmius oreades]